MFWFWPIKVFLYLSFSVQVHLAIMVKKVKQLFHILFSSFPILFRNVSGVAFANTPVSSFVGRTK
jgi:hypothetical protein